MGEKSNETVTAALTFKVPQKVGWSVQCNDLSWIGDELLALLDCLAQQPRNKSLTLSVSLIFELTRNEGTVRSSSGIPRGDSQ